MYSDFEFYQDGFYGNLIPMEDFPRFASRASDFIDYYTEGKAEQASDESILTLIKKACCAIAEQMYLDEQSKAIAAKSFAAALSSESGEIKSESVGSWSRSYATASDYVAKSASMKDSNASYAAIARQYLANTGLLYRGGCCGCNYRTV